MVPASGESERTAPEGADPLIEQLQELGSAHRAPARALGKERDAPGEIVSHAEIPLLLRNHDVYVQPSINPLQHGKKKPSVPSVGKHCQQRQLLHTFELYRRACP